MRKTYGLWTGAVAAIVLIAAQAGAEPVIGSWYAGAVMLPLEVTGLEDVAVSDWENYGLGSAEGRISLPLSQGATSGSHAGFLLGYDYPLLPVLSGIGEIQMTFSPATSLGALFIGVNCKLLENERFSLGLAPKIGYAFGTIDFGETAVLPGKTPPVITPEGTFYSGEEVEATLSGAAFQAMLNANYALTDKIGINLQAGWTQAFLGDLRITAGDVILAKDSPAVVKNDGSADQAGIDPKAAVQGLSVALGLTFRL